MDTSIERRIVFCDAVAAAGAVFWTSQRLLKHLSATSAQRA